MTRRFSGGTKQARVRDYLLLQAAPRFTIAEIRRAVPGVSDNTIRLVLGEEKQSGRITHDGSGRWHRPISDLSSPNKGPSR